MSLKQSVSDSDSRDAESPPRCPECEYVLIGLTSRTCPECGLALGSDLDAYRSAPAPTIWQRGKPFRPLRGVLLVLRHPIRTLGVCGHPDRVTFARAAIFAVLVSMALVAAWPVIREVGLVIGCSVAGWRDPAFSIVAIGESGLRSLLNRHLWLRLCAWELWSVARWWLLFGTLVIMLGPLAGGTPRTGDRSMVATVVCRLLLFAPWIALLEIGFLIGVWFDEPQVVPEPATFFAVNWARWPLRPWLIRGVLPSAIVGYLLFRAALGWRRAAAIAWAIVFIPIAIYASIAWSILYMDLFLR